MHRRSAKARTQPRCRRPASEWASGTRGSALAEDPGLYLETAARSREAEPLRRRLALARSEFHIQTLPAVLALGQVGSPATRELLFLPCSSAVPLLLAFRCSRWIIQPPNPKQSGRPFWRKLNRFGDEVGRREPCQQPLKVESFPHQRTLSRPGMLPATDDPDPRSLPTGGTQQCGEGNGGSHRDWRG